MTGPPVSGWRLRALLACNLAAALIAGSWLLPATRARWDALDERVFRALNGSLASGEGWQTFWAWANWRPADAVPALFMGGLLLWWLVEGGRKLRGRRVATLIAFTIAVLVMHDLVEILCDDILGWRRRSPTLVLPDVQLLSKLVPSVQAKVISGKCFPGDHAFGLMTLVAFLWVHTGKRRGLCALLLLSPFMLPRLVGGAHWLTDILVGSVCMTLLVISWWFATPLGERAAAAAHWAMPRILSVFRRDNWQPRSGSRAT